MGILPAVAQIPPDKIAVFIAAVVCFVGVLIYMKRKEGQRKSKEEREEAIYRRRLRDMGGERL